MFAIACIRETLREVGAACARWPGNSLCTVELSPATAHSSTRASRVPFSTSARGVGSSSRWSGIRTAAFMVAYACSHETQRGRKTAERSPSAATVASGAVPPAHEGGHLRSAPIRRSLTVHAERDLPANGYHDPVRDYGHAVHHLGGDAVWGGRWHGGIGTGRSGGLSAGRRRGVRTGRRLATCGPT